MGVKAADFADRDAHDEGEKSAVSRLNGPFREAPRAGQDVLKWPVIGPFLRWRHARTAVQLPLLLLAIIVVAHGFVGPQVSPLNLATVLSWIDYRGLLVIVLLAAGNFLCMGCPFVLVRDSGRRLHTPSMRWPRRLRTKWLGIGLLVGVLFAYELFDLWALPRATAWLVVAYFVAALAVDLTFAGASFCKYLCPIGQFNFVASTMSPLEIRVREPDTCRECRTADCIKGRVSQSAPLRVLQRGCELDLFLPAKVGNLDCTFCMDCVQACPHDNVALSTRVPGEELAADGWRSSIGRLTTRNDIAALVVVFTFGALMNEFGMTAPVYAVERWLGAMLGVSSELPVLALLFALALVVMPFVLLGGAAAAARWLLGGESSLLEYSYALLPLGVGVWLSHYSFHFLTSALTIIPVTQSAIADLAGRQMLGAPNWRWMGMRPGSVFPIQLGLIIMGTMGSVGLAYQISQRSHRARAITATIPWTIVIAILGMVAAWILAQPMEMRGAFLG